MSRFLNALNNNRWLLVTAFTILLAGLELIQYYISTHHGPDQTYLVLSFAIAPFLLAGIALSIPSDFGKTRALVSRTTSKVKRRVLVATKEMLLGAGIESMLQRQKSLDLVGMSQTGNLGLIKKIDWYKPEVVILDEMVYLANAKDLLTLMDASPEIRLVVVSANENRVQVFNKRQIQVTQSMDLVEMMCHT